jgi:hypothetical protein
MDFNDIVDLVCWVVLLYVLLYIFMVLCVPLLVFILMCIPCCDVCFHRILLYLSPNKTKDRPMEPMDLSELGAILH